MNTAQWNSQNLDKAPLLFQGKHLHLPGIGLMLKCNEQWLLLILKISNSANVIIKGG
jgi:hypothetical protein